MGNKVSKAFLLDCQQVEARFVEYLVAHCTMNGMCGTLVWDTQAKMYNLPPSPETCP